jgi:hypothetical protein
MSDSDLLVAIAVQLGKDQARAVDIYKTGCKLEATDDAASAAHEYKKAFKLWPALNSVARGNLPLEVIREAETARAMPTHIEALAEISSKYSDPHILVAQEADEAGREVAEALSHTERIATFFSPNKQDYEVGSDDLTAKMSKLALSEDMLPGLSAGFPPIRTTAITAAAYDTRMLLHCDGLDLDRYRQDGTVAAKQSSEQPARISSIWNSLLLHCSGHSNWRLLR